LKSAATRMVKMESTISNGNPSSAARISTKDLIHTPSMLLTGTVKLINPFLNKRLSRVTQYERCTCSLL
jgi:hypothetical protein